MTIKEKFAHYKNKTVTFCKEHKTGIIIVGTFFSAFVLGAITRKNYSNGIPIWDHDALGLKEGDNLDLNTGEVTNSLDEYDWNEKNRIVNWELAKEFASRISLEDGEMYMFYNGESGDGRYIDNGINGTIIEHLDGCGNPVYPETVDDHEWECKFDVMGEIDSQNARILNFANTIDFAENTSYTIEKDENGKTQVVYKQWLSAQ